MVHSHPIPATQRAEVFGSNVVLQACVSPLRGSMNQTTYLKQAFADRARYYSIEIADPGGLDGITLAIISDCTNSPQSLGAAIDFVIRQPITPCGVDDGCFETDRVFV